MLKDNVQKTEILASIDSDHSPIVIKFGELGPDIRGPSIWKYPSTLSQDLVYVNQVKKLITDVQNELAEPSHQLRWEYVKFKIREFSINYSKKKAKQKRQQIDRLETIITAYENTPTDTQQDTYESARIEYDELLTEKTNGHILRAKTKDFQSAEKCSKYFLNLEKKRAINNTLKRLCIDSENPTEITHTQTITNEIKKFYSNLYSTRTDETSETCSRFLDEIDFPTLSIQENNFLNQTITIDNLKKAIKNSKNGKSPGSDGLTREFYIVFWIDVSELVFNSLNEAKSVGELSDTQRQAVIKLLDKRKYKRFIKNLRPISLINYDTKMLSKTLADRLREVLPSLISCDQTAYIKDRFLGESVRLISDVLEVSKSYNLDGYLLTIDIEKAFDSVEHNFLFASLEEYGFHGYFLDWIKILLKNQQSCVLNGGNSTGFFPLQRGSRQGDPISAYLFILVIEVIFNAAKSDANIKPLEMFDTKFLLTSYADDTTFFLKDPNSAKIIFGIFEKISRFSGLKVNSS